MGRFSASAVATVATAAPLASAAARISEVLR